MDLQSGITLISASIFLIGFGACGGSSRRCAPALQGSQTFSNGELGEFSDAMQAEFCHELLAIGFDGLHAYLKQMGDFLSSSAFRQELENFPLPRRQEREG